MEDFFSQIYYGNTVTEWTIALGIIVGSVLVGRVLYWIFSRYIKFLARRTRARLDDLLIDMVEEPIVAIFILYWIRYSLVVRLDLGEMGKTFVENGYRFILAILVAWLILRVYEAFHQEYLGNLVKDSENDLDDQLLPIIRSGLRFIIISLGIIIGLNNAGYDVGTVLAGLGIGGLAFALAAQDTVANVFGGITILLQRPFQIGDLIILDDQWLSVKEIGLRASILTDYDYNHVIYIPNSRFTSSKVTNVSRYPSHWRYQYVQLSPFNPVDKIEQGAAILTQVVEDNPETTPFTARVDKVEPGAIQIFFIYIINDYAKRHQVISEITLEFLRRFEAEGIKLAVPVAFRISDSLPEQGPYGV